MKTHDLDRLRQEYADREKRLAGSEIYSPFNPAHLFIIQSRQRAVLKMLQSHGFDPLKDCRILELGCGRGGVLLEYLQSGINPGHLHGTDLIEDRIQDAHKFLPHLALTCADGQNLPYSTNTFDLVLQYTVFSSVLDDSIKTNLGREMLHVLRKPKGMAVWYDYWLNPTNPHARGIRKAEIRRLFPHCQFEFHRITLAPPIARFLVPISWILALMLWKT